MLELVRLVSTGDGVFQPRVTRIEGVERILEALSQSRAGRVLLDSARTVVQAAPADGDLRFEPGSTGWTESRLSPSYIRELDARSPQRDVEAGLRAELVVVRAAYEGLAERVLRLEKALANGVPGQVSVPRGESPGRSAARTPPVSAPTSAAHPVLGSSQP